MNLYTRALQFAAEAHDTQLQKYTGRPYILHPIEVAEIVRRADGTPSMVAAALLHDVVEDTAVTIEMIRLAFGPDIADMVGWLTDEPTVEGGPNRAARKKASRDRLAGAPARVQTIKLADLIHNTASIVEHDRKFAATYLPEMELLLCVLERGNLDLFNEASTKIRWALADLHAKPSCYE